MNHVKFAAGVPARTARMLPGGLDVVTSVPVRVTVTVRVRVRVGVVFGLGFGLANPNSNPSPNQVTSVLLNPTPG